MPVSHGVGSANYSRAISTLELEMVVDGSRMTKTNGSGAAVAMVLLRNPANLERNRIAAYLQDAFSGGQVEVTPSTDAAGGGLLVTWDGVPFAVMAIDRPVPADTFERSHRQAFSAKDVPSIVAQQQAHLIVSAMISPKDMAGTIHLAIRTLILSYVLSELGDPVGLYWCASDTVLNKGRFDDVADIAMDALLAQAGDAPGDVPWQVLVGLQIWKNGSAIESRTNGLAAYTGYELEVREPDWEVAKHFEYLASVVAYLLQSGSILKHGNTLEVDDGVTFQVDANGTEIEGVRHYGLSGIGSVAN